MEKIGNSMLRRGEKAYYYCLLNRVDEITSEDLDRPFSTIKLEWGDLHLIPHEYGFYAFAISRHMRTGERLENIVQELRDLVKRDIDEGTSHYEERKGKKQSWQDIHSRDMLAIFHDDLSIATKDGKKRIELLWEYYPQLAQLRKIEIPGPNKTSIYILAESQHEELFINQFSEVIESRKPIIEKITRARKRARNLL